MFICWLFIAFVFCPRFSGISFGFQLIVFAGGVLFVVDVLVFLPAPTTVCHHNVLALVTLGPRARPKRV